MRIMNLKRCAIVLICLLAPGLPAVADVPAVHWERRIDHAMPIAVREKKDLLINFTAHGWCHYCVMLEREVFSHAEFAAASDNFVLVEVDFPSGDDAAAKDLHDLYAKWQKQFLAFGVPTVVLADATGRPYGYTGYDHGITPRAFLDHLGELQDARRKRDKYLAQAKTLVGIERAKALHAALEAIRTPLGTIGGHRDDPLLVLYGDVVDEIRRLDADNAAGLRGVYDKRQSDRTAWLAREAIFTRLNQAKNYKAAIVLLDEALASAKDEEFRGRLELNRQIYLELDHQYPAALENARRLLHDPATTSGNYENFLDREAIVLCNLGRIDEGIASYDRQIASAVDHRETRLSLLNRKSRVLLDRGVSELSIRACREYRQALDPSSVDWESATTSLADQLKQSGQHQQSLAVHEELLEHYRKASKQPGRDTSDATQGIVSELLLIAECQQLLGHDERARRSLDEAERLIPHGGKRHADKEAVATLRKRLTELRKAAVAQK